VVENMCGWITQAGVSPPGAMLEGPQKADWLVIGGGFTGLSAAHTLAELHPQSRIILVDRQRAAQGASARNSGFVVAYEGPAPDELLGRKQNAHYLVASAIGKAASNEVARRVAALGIECDRSSDGYLFAVRDPAKLEEADSQVQTLREAGASAELLEGHELAQRLGSSFHQAGIWCRGGNGLLQPAKYAKGLLDALPENVSVYENTEISGLEHLRGGGIRARSSNGHVEARQVLACVGAFLPRPGLADSTVFPLELSAPHPEAALRWINYIEDPKVNAAITNEVFYPTANHAAREFVIPAVAQDPTVYPPDDVLKKMTLMKPTPIEIVRLENRLWAQLKTLH
jgi:glycine/D-amino acid oxidase-like deaminating enzyme